jgi:Gnt-I system low-affinity gluconate transporter
MVVGLGAMFGAILESSGGAEALAQQLLKIFGEKKASWALMLTGFIVAIPVFFDVAFIILVPLVYALQRKTKKSLLLYAIPLLAGLAITHAFIPPTPGPVAVADILKADLGWVILIGFLAGVPTAIICGPLFARFIARRIQVEAPKMVTEQVKSDKMPSIYLIIGIIALPIILILSNTLINSPMMADSGIPAPIRSSLQLLGHPFAALIIANLVAWYFLGVRSGFSKDRMLQITTRSMEPAGIIILLTGAGGVFKQMLVNTGTGVMLASYFAEAGFSILLFAFIAAAIVRILQGSATVAMITAAGITAPLLAANIAEIDKALLVIAIASGASILSHVNDSGFWLVGKYLNLSEKQTLYSWSVMTTLLALVGFATVSLLSMIL